MGKLNREERERKRVSIAKQIADSPYWHFDKLQSPNSSLRAITRRAHKIVLMFVVCSVHRRLLVWPPDVSYWSSEPIAAECLSQAAAILRETTRCFRDPPTVCVCVCVWARVVGLLCAKAVNVPTNDGCQRTRGRDWKNSEKMATNTPTMRSIRAV